MKTNQSTFYFATADEAESAFYSALEMGDVQLMDAVLAAEGVCCIHPGTSAIVGRQPVLDSWVKILPNVNHTALSTEVLLRTSYDDIAIHLVAEFLADSHQPDAETAVVFATNVYVLQNNGWRLQSHHASQATSKKQKPTSIVTHDAPQTLQ